ncbi:PCYCGC motif-containing (lipo)protein [Bacillus sp. 165]|uniref:PCYCGC motif-containing (lipo)protein n=1 Tax=Bacillus sp. 165 TaxID=1529117 RepID=UPI001ADBE8E3|nr:PCYCGC motif-containing (lipo)protein [Bacillus sp. 165]MBO9128816.1 hypothetical protein [Bacillus sp. 165]
MKNYWFLFVSVMASVVLVITGCSSNDRNSHESTNHEERTVSDSHQHGEGGDIFETTKDIVMLPSFLSNQPEQIQNIYQIAGQNHELLSWIPCYCGCGESAGHTSNKNCFIREVKPNGEVVWDSHAITCTACLEIALQSAVMKEKGASALEIRQYIDEQYKEGYAKPTPTPMPSL